MPAGLINIDAQMRAIADRWPGLPLIESGSRSAVWEGVLRPADRDFTVRISYQVPFAIENFSALDVQPRVQVIDPVLERHESYEEGPIPHVYVCRAEPTLPYLCLFDPFSEEWSPADLLAETTVPWTARYLYFYEGWLLTGCWKGGGRHATPTQRGSATAGEGKSIAAV